MQASLAVAGRAIRRSGLLVVVVLTIASLGACSHGNKTAASPDQSRAATPSATDWRSQARGLLETYDLHAAGEPTQTSRGRLRSGEMGFTLYSDVSKSIGLDLASHAGQRATWYSIPLEGFDQPDASATFIVRGNRVIGAGLYLFGDPGVYPLDYVRSDK